MASIVVGGLLITAAAGGIAAGAGATAAGVVVVRKKQRKKKLKKLRKKLFGEPMDLLNLKYLTNDGIPLVLELTCRQLEEKGSEAEGLFRVPGSLNRIQFLADAFRAGTEKALAKINLDLEDTHDVGGVFKLYFRSLPAPLCTFELFDLFMGVHDTAKNHTDWLDKLVRVLNRLPEVNRLVFLRILPFFAHVASLAEVNFMTVENIAIVFGPTLFSCSDPDPYAMLKSCSSTCNLLIDMIVHHEEIREKASRQGTTRSYSKDTVNVSVLFSKQKLVDVFPEMEAGDELEEEELETIKELLQDNFAVAKNGSSLNEDFFLAPEPTKLEEHPPLVPTNPRASSYKKLPPVPVPLSTNDRASSDFSQDFLKKLPPIPPTSDVKNLPSLPPQGGPVREVKKLPPRPPPRRS